jgi:hypothetical protein
MAERPLVGAIWLEKAGIEIPCAHLIGGMCSELIALRSNHGQSSEILPYMMQFFLQSASLSVQTPAGSSNQLMAPASLHTPPVSPLVTVVDCPQ